MKESLPVYEGMINSIIKELIGWFR